MSTDPEYKHLMDVTTNTDSDVSALMNENQTMKKPITAI